MDEDGDGGGGGGGEDTFHVTGPPVMRCKCAVPQVEMEEGGVSVCSICGTVLEENIIVNTVEFQESTSGRTSVVGQFVSSTQFKAMSTLPGAGPAGANAPGQGKERDVTLISGRKIITELVARLHCPLTFIDMAFRLFGAAVTRNFVQGRKTAIVCAAALYTVCRREGNSVMLMDFSDVLQINIFVLGKTFLKFTKKIGIHVAVIDPSLYIHRFAGELEFENQTHAVATTALKIVARMKRDYMVLGRRPAGVCGAALIIAARIHGFNRTQKEVVEVLRICEETLRQRLHEFESTPSGKLSMEEFLTQDLPTECDPPSFIRNRKLEDAARLAIEGIKEKHASFAAIANASESLALAIAETETQKLALMQHKQKLRKDKQDTVFDDIEKELRDALNSIGETDLQGISSSSSSSSGPTSEPGIEVNQSSSSSSSSSNEPGPTITTHQPRSSSSTALVVSKPAFTMQTYRYEGAEISLSDSDVDVDDLMLNEEEVQKKTAIWERKHKAYLENQLAESVPNDTENPDGSSRSERKKKNSSKGDQSDGEKGGKKGTPKKPAKSTRINYEKIVVQKGVGGATSLPTGAPLQPRKRNREEKNGEESSRKKHKNLQKGVV